MSFSLLSMMKNFKEAPWWPYISVVETEVLVTFRQNVLSVYFLFLFYLACNVFIEIKGKESNIVFF